MLMRMKCHLWLLMQANNLLFWLTSMRQWYTFKHVPFQKYTSPTNAWHVKESWTPCNYRWCYLYCLALKLSNTFHFKCSLLLFINCQSFLIGLLGECLRLDYSRKCQPTVWSFTGREHGFFFFFFLRRKMTSIFFHKAGLYRGWLYTASVRYSLTSDSTKALLFLDVASSDDL